MKIDDTIIQENGKASDPLRQIAKEIQKEEFNTPYISEVIKVMQKVLSKESDGVALAAPQINLPLRIFVVSPNAYPDNAKSKPLVFINPKIIKKSKKSAIMEEGCLSVRWIYGKTKRSVSVTIESYDIIGNKFTYGASGLMAHIFQHETDHLDGVLFIDHGFDFQEYTEEEVRESQKNDKPLKK